jgi:hypothetical protein
MAGSLTYGYTQAQQFDIGNKWEWVDLLKDFIYLLMEILYVFAHAVFAQSLLLSQDISR